MKDLVGVEWGTALVREMKAREDEVCEILSDVSAEQYLNALVARSLRQFGRKRFGESERFWVRSEWGKTDVSYGKATCQIKNWDRDWMNKNTGDLGQLEVKLIYTHYGDADVTARLAELVRQLKARRAADRKYHDAEYSRAQRYDGMIWIFHHGYMSAEPEEQGFGRVKNAFMQSAAGPLETVLEFQSAAKKTLGNIWPNVDGDYTGHLWMGIVRLPDSVA